MLEILIAVVCGVIGISFIVGFAVLMNTSAKTVAKTQRTYADYVSEHGFINVEAESLEPGAVCEQSVRKGFDAGDLRFEYRRLVDKLGRESFNYITMKSIATDGVLIVMPKKLVKTTNNPQTDDIIKHPGLPSLMRKPEANKSLNAFYAAAFNMTSAPNLAFTRLEQPQLMNQILYSTNEATAQMINQEVIQALSSPEARLNWIVIAPEGVVFSWIVPTVRGGRLSELNGHQIEARIAYARTVHKALAR